MSQVKERPILFSAPMVRAILEDRKTVTRRVIKPQPNWDGKWFQWDGHAPNSKDGAVGGNTIEAADLMCWSSPYGKRGDRLWVRETCFINDYREAGVPVDERADCEIHYRADGIPDFEGEEELIRWRPSIHMPRWASRILLEITDVRVERLQDISEEQARAEGVRLMREDSGTWVSREGPGKLVTPWPTAKEAFSDLWNSINGLDAWDANPWVWCMNFKRVTP